MLLRLISIILFVLVLITPTIPHLAQSSNDNIITEDNITLGYILPSRCGDISPDSSLFVTRSETLFVRDIETSEIVWTLLEPSDDRVERHYFSSDSRYIWRQYDGIYDLENGERILRHETGLIQPYDRIFSPDSHFAFIKMSGFNGLEALLYSLETREIVLEFSIREDEQGIRWQFSSDDQYLAIDTIGVYDLNTLELIIADENFRRMRFSPNSRYIYALTFASGAGRSRLYDLSNNAALIAESFGIGTLIDWSQDEDRIVGMRSVYSLSEATQLLRYENSATARISPNGRYVGVSRDGLYDLEDNSRLVTFTNHEHIRAFSPLGTHFLTSQDGTSYLYALPSGEQLYSLSNPNWGFNEDGTLIILCHNCTAFDVATGEQRFIETNYGVFSNDRRYMINSDFVNIGTYDRPFCRVYSTDRSNWEQRTGLVSGTGVNVRAIPSTQGRIIASSSGDWVVIARTPENNWYHVRVYNHIYGWVSASVVEVIDLPESVPIRTE